MSSVNKQKHIRLKLAFSDLIHCNEYADLLNIDERGQLGSKERTIYTALLTSFVVAYGRAVSRSYTQTQQHDGEVCGYFKELIANEIDLLTEKERQLHKILIEQRDVVFAHSDAKPKSLMAFESPFGGSVDYIGIDNTVGYEADDLRIIRSVVNKILRAIDAEVVHIEEQGIDALIE